MKLINTKNIIGYRLKDIKDELSTKEYERFCKWLNGQTTAIINGELIVYVNDWNRYINNLPPID